MGKKNEFVFTIGFNRNDPEHIHVAELLNTMKHGKAQYIVRAVLTYQKVSAGQQQEEKPSLDYKNIEKLVHRIITEHEQKAAGLDVIENNSSQNVELFDNTAINEIMSSLEAFKG